VALSATHLSPVIRIHTPWKTHLAVVPIVDLPKSPTTSLGGRQQLLTEIWQRNVCLNSNFLRQLPNRRSSAGSDCDCNRCNCNSWLPLLTLCGHRSMAHRHTARKRGGSIKATCGNRPSDFELRSRVRWDTAAHSLRAEAETETASKIETETETASEFESESEARAAAFSYSIQLGNRKWQRYCCRLSDAEMLPWDLFGI